MPTKKIKNAKASAKKLAGAVVLTASFSLFAIPDAQAESGCLSITGAMDGYNIFSDGGGGGCTTHKDRGSSDGVAAGGPDLTDGYL